MRDKKEFYSIVTTLDGKEFSEYARLIGDFDFSRYVLKVSQIQEEPGSDPSVFVVRVPQIIAAFPQQAFGSPVRRAALEDLLIRKIADDIEQMARYDEQGISRKRLSIARPGQKILPRTSVVVTEEYVEARLYITMPVRDGKIPGDAVKALFFDDLPAIVTSSMMYCNLNEAEVSDAIDLMQDADQIRQVLPTRGLVAFVAEGSLLSRLPGTDVPDYGNLVPLTVDDACKVEIEVPNAGSVKGLGLAAGITLILGDEYSGRVDLMKALGAGIYNHVHGDGRELAITVSDAVAPPAEAGRCIQRMDLSLFISGLPDGSDPACYTTTNADPVASQAAATMEAIEVGARVLLYDESTSAPSFLVRDARLSGLLGQAEHRLAPLSVRARQIVDDLGVSIVVGGAAVAAQFIPVADTILQVDGFEVRDITQAAKKKAIADVSGEWPAVDIAAIVEKVRWVVPSSLDPSVGKHDAYIDAPAVDELDFGRSVVDLSAVSQLADVHQTATIGLILYYAKLRYMDESRPIREVLDLVDRDLSTEGLECLTRDLRGDLARPRRYEIAATLNRLDTLRILPPAN